MLGPSKRELLRIIEQERKQHRGELSGLLDRLANAQGQPWTLPPREAAPEPEPRLWSASPEQVL